MPANMPKAPDVSVRAAMPANRPETFDGMVSWARPAPTAGAGFFGRSGSWSRWWWVRLLVVGGRSGRWSVRGGVPTLERGNDQHDQMKADRL